MFPIPVVCFPMKLDKANVFKIFKKSMKNNSLEDEQPFVSS